MLHRCRIYLTLQATKGIAVVATWEVILQGKMQPPLRASWGRCRAATNIGRWGSESGASSLTLWSSIAQPVRCGPTQSTWQQSRCRAGSCAGVCLPHKTSDEARAAPVGGRCTAAALLYGSVCQLDASTPRELPGPMASQLVQNPGSPSQASRQRLRSSRAWQTSAGRQSQQP